MKFLRKMLKAFFSRLPRFFVHVKNQEILNETKWIEKLSKLYMRMIRVIPEYHFHLFFLTYSIQISNLVIDNDDNYQRIKELWMCFFMKTSEEIKVFLARVFYEANIFDDEISKILVSFALSTKDCEYRYWMAMDISQMTFIRQKGFYPDYYNERRRLLKEIACEGKYSFIPYPNEKNGKLLIITYLLSSTIFNSLQRVALMVNRGLKPHFSEITILSMESFSRPTNYKKKFSSLFQQAKEEQEQKKIMELFDKDTRVFFAKGDTPLECMNETLKTISEIKPEAIVDLTDEYSAISYIYSQYIPTLYIPLRSYASSSFFTASTGRTWKYELVNKIFHCIDMNKVRDWSFPEYVPMKGEPLSRKSIGLKENSFVIISIGNNDTVCDDKLIDYMSNLLQSNSSFVWLLVGGGAPSYLHKKYPHLLEQRQVVEHGFEKNLRSLCECCDILLRANTSGGSGGTAIGAMSGLPIVMTNYLSDPMRWLGKDFSEISDYSGLMDEIMRLFSDKKYYLMKSKLAKEKVSIAINSEEIWIDLRMIILDLVEKFI